MITNAVKHFSWEPQEHGKRRIHKKPRASEVAACRPWLDGELAVMKPEVVVCLGATAAQSLLGRTFSVTRQRGQVVNNSPIAPKVVATVHPSSILRAQDDNAREVQMREFVRDLSKIARLINFEGLAADCGLPRPATLSRRALEFREPAINYSKCTPVVKAPIPMRVRLSFFLRA